MKTVDHYTFQALDNYPYSLMETIESLDYALAYDKTNVTALCLYGRVYSEQLENYEQAISYFQEALASDVGAVAVYPYFIDALISFNEWDEAERLISFALTLKGINRYTILFRYVHLMEVRGNWKAALEGIKKLTLASVTNNESEIERLKQRIKTKQSLAKEKLMKKGKNKKK